MSKGQGSVQPMLDWLAKKQRKGSVPNNCLFFNIFLCWLLLAPTVLEYCRKQAQAIQHYSTLLHNVPHCHTLGNASEHWRTRQHIALNCIQLQNITYIYNTSLYLTISFLWRYILFTLHNTSKQNEQKKTIESTLQHT